MRLKTTIESVRHLSLQACAFRGHDESAISNNRGNFIEMVKAFGRMNNTSPTILKEIFHIIAHRVRRKIREEVGDAKFCILVDEAKDSANKQEMSVVL